MRTIKRDIAGALLFSNDGHVLIGKNVKGGVYEDLWVIPGGGIDDGESKEEAVRREILEEVGIDISDATIEPVFRNEKRTTEKTLRDTGERVLVDMTFYDFKVMIDLPAQDIPIKLEDDFGLAEWVPVQKLGEKSYSPAVESLLKSLSLIK
jgi:8-oxo-dGTP pyrophosphatase MutT (NUDIX family)